MDDQDALEPDGRSDTIIMMDWTRDNEVPDHTNGGWRYFVWHQLICSLIHQDVEAQDETLVMSKNLPKWFGARETFPILEEVFDCGGLTATGCAPTPNSGRHSVRTPRTPPPLLPSAVTAARRPRPLRARHPPSSGTFSTDESEQFSTGVDNRPSEQLPQASQRMSWGGSGRFSSFNPMGRALK